MKKATATLLMLCFSLLISTSVWAQKTTYTTKDVLDNIEEYVSDGSWDSGSSDLEIGYEKPGDDDQEQQIIGVRFQGVTIPAADEIAKAYIQFTQDEDKNQSPFSATIWGQAIGDAPQFQEVTYAVSSREKTNASVSWTDIPEWTVTHEQDKDQQTPDLTEILKEIQARGDWENGQSIAFIIEATGTRTAVSYDGGGEAYAPMLIIETATTASYQPASSADDAEEGDDGPGVMDIDSSDLEIVMDHEDDPSRNQTVGIRFRGISIPQGAEVQSAYIQFDVDEDDKNADPFEVTITGEANAYPEAFSNTLYDISSRTRTAASVEWNDIPMWTTKHEAGEDQRTSDLTPIVQEIVNRTDWYGGNNMVFILEGTGQRTAESFDGAGDNTGQRPTLVVKFIGEEERPSIEKIKATWNDDPATTMVVSWDQVDGESPVVKWDTTDHGRNADAYPNTLAPYKSVSAYDMNTRFAKFENLAPNTMVYFVVKDSLNTSKRYSFLTAPDSPEPFAYIAGGDTKSSGDAFLAGQYSNQMVAKLRPLFVLFSGDFNSGDGTSPSRWDDWLTNWSEQTTTEDGRLIPIIAVHGNHENGDYEVLHKLFDTPETNGYVYNFYALTFGGNLLKVFTLNSELQNGDTYATAFEAMNQWLADELAASTDVTFKTCGYHKPLHPHTSGKSENPTLINAWANLFYDYGMDVSCDADSHMHKLTFPLAPCDDSDPDCFQDFKVDVENGTFYLGEGSWGASPRRHDDDKPWTLDSDSFNQFKWIHVYPATGNQAAYLSIRTVITGKKNCYYDNCAEGETSGDTVSLVPDVESLTEANKYTTIPENIVFADTPYLGTEIQIPFNRNTYSGDVPATPANLAGEATSYTEIALNWENTSTESVQKIILEYKVNDGAWAELSSQIQPEVDSYSLEGLEDGTDYAFRLRARNIFGYSAFSNAVTVSTPKDARLKVTFQEGVNGYSGALDMELRDASPDTVFDGASQVTVDMSDGGVVQGIMKFKNIIEAIPGNAVIANAELRILTTGSSGGDQSFYRMLKEWPDACTWNSIGSTGVTPDGAVAADTADGSVNSPSSGEYAYLDVTQSVKAWVDGAPNYGWGIINSSTDGWDFYASEASVATNRPKLSIYYTIEGDLDADGDVDRNDLAVIRSHLRATASVCEACDIDGDGRISIRDARLLIKNCTRTRCATE